MRPPHAQSRPPGFALLIVLWSLVLIGLLMTQILGAGRIAVKLAGNIRDAAVTRAAADGAINEALFHVLAAGGDHWAPDGVAHDLGGGLTVRITGFADRINPNLASTGLLTGLFEAIGAPRQQAAALAAGIIQWRSPAATKPAAAAEQAAYRAANLPYGPPGKPFADLNTLADVIGMTPALLAKVEPYMSLYQTDDPNPALSGQVVRDALSLAGQTGAKAGVYNGTIPTVAIEARAEAPGSVAIRQAIVSLAGPGAPVPFRFVSLTNGR